MSSKKSAGQAVNPSVLEYKVITVTELDQMVYKRLRIDGAAKPDEENPGQYIVTERELAKSQVVMPKVLNALGKQGWQLTAVNKMECYIFSKTQQSAPVEYKVMTPGDLDRMSMELLEKSGAMQLSHFEGLTPAVEIVEPEKAKIQNVLPKVLSGLADEGWRLCAVNGPQLYFFSRDK